MYLSKTMAFQNQNIRIKMYFNLKQDKKVPPALIDSFRKKHTHNTE